MLTSGKQFLAWEPILLDVDDDGSEEYPDLYLHCPCEKRHGIVVTSYGYRAQCDFYSVRWTALSGPLPLEWVPEPYTTMTGRSTS